MKFWTIVVGMAVILGVGCGSSDSDDDSSTVVSGFTFEITIDPDTFAPASVEDLLIASTGDPGSNPPDTVQLYTPNDTLTWQSGTDVDYFSFDVELTNFYSRKHCHLRVVVDAIIPEGGRFFQYDDRGTEYASNVTGAGVWAYGDLDAHERETRRWTVGLRSRDSFTLTGRVVADDEACDAYAR